MIRALSLFAILCGVLFVYGFLMVDRIRIQVRAIPHRPDIDVVVTVPNVTPEDRWLSLYGCSAEMDDDNRLFCNDGWERASTQEVRADQRQYVFPWRSVPSGWLQFAAAVKDANGKTLAAGETRVIR